MVLRAASASFGPLRWEVCSPAANLLRVKPLIALAGAEIGIREWLSRDRVVLLLIVKAAQIALGHG